MVEALLDTGAPAEASNKAGNTPLHFAAQKGHSAIVAPLAKAGAKVDQASRTGFTPLHLAAQNGHAGVVGALLALGHPADQPSNDGSTPLHLVRAGRWDQQRWLPRLSLGWLARAPRGGCCESGREKRPRRRSFALSMLLNLLRLSDAAPGRRNAGVRGWAGRYRPGSSRRWGVARGGEGQRRHSHACCAQEVRHLHIAIYQGGGWRENCFRRSAPPRERPRVQLQNVEAVVHL